MVTSMSSPPSGLTILRLPQVVARLGLGRSSIYMQCRAGLLPPAIQIGTRAVGWISSELDAVIAARAAGVSPEAIQQLVRQLVSARASGLRVVAPHVLPLSGPTIPQVSALSGAA